MNFRYIPNRSGPRRRLWPRRVWWGAFLGAAAFCLSLSGGEPEQAASSRDVRPQDQVWLASTRHVTCGSDGAPALWRWSAGQWQAADQQQFVGEQEKFPHTVIYIHGNRVGDNEGVSGGLTVYQQVIARHAVDDGVRFVIWSWPSTKICGPIKDVRSKAWRSDDEAVMLARFLDGIHGPDTQAKKTSDLRTVAISTRDTTRDAAQRVGFVAFSYGARITGGALHLLGGGELDGITIPKRQRPQFRVAFWAAGMHNDWLLPEHRHGQALPLADKWFSATNRCDESLWRYERLEKCGNPPALGFAGFAARGQLPAELQSRWEEWDVANIVGSTHNYPPYVYSSWIAEQTANCVLWKE